MRFGPFAHGRRQRAGRVGPPDAECWRWGRSPGTIGRWADLAVRPDTSDARHFANNAVAVIVAATAASAAGSDCRTPAAASSCLAAMEIAFSAAPAADTATCAGDRRPQLPPIAAFATDAASAAAFVGGRSPSQLPTDMAMLAHWSGRPIRPNRQVLLVRQRADRPCRTYCRRAIDTSDTGIVAEIAVAMDVAPGAGRMHPAVPWDGPQPQSHHIDSMHLCVD